MNQYASVMPCAFGESGVTGANPPFPASAGVAATSAARSGADDDRRQLAHGRMHSMKVTEQVHRRTLARLPADVTRPFEVFVNGVPQVEGADYEVMGGVLLFERELRSEGKLGFWRWAAIFVGVVGHLPAERLGRPRVHGERPQGRRDQAAARAGRVTRAASRTPAGNVPPTWPNATTASRSRSLVRDFKTLRAVDGIDLHVDPGEIYGFLGPNGAGKSTTVLMLTTLLPPTSGTARVAGHDVVHEGPKVRAAIGAALQEAALDPLLTGRDHLRLQATLQGIPKRERRARCDELLERVGLADAADRKVRGYSGGMKRRLDLALALVHRPRIVFLDEPTTGLDIQSRTALWQEVARLARDEGVTVFLTTQYLEEADVLADRVGIIDHGHIVAEGTPAALKAEIGRPSVHATPAADDEAERIARGARSASASRSPDATRDIAVRLRRRDRRSRRGRAGARRRRARRREPRVAAADARRRLPRQDRALARGRGRRRGRAATEAADAPVSVALASQVGAVARRSVTRTLRQPASAIPPLVFPVALMAVNAGGLKASTHAARLPDALVPRLRARRALHPGRALLDDERRHGSRARHPDGLPQPAVADLDARLGAAGRPARRDRRARSRPGGLLHRRRAASPGSTSRPGRPGSSSCSPSRRSCRSASARSGASWRCEPAPARRSRGSSRCSSSSCSSRR